MKKFLLVLMAFFLSLSLIVSCRGVDGGIDINGGSSGGTEVDDGTDTGDIDDSSNLEKFSFSSFKVLHRDNDSLCVGSKPLLKELMKDIPFDYVKNVVSEGISEPAYGGFTVPCGLDYEVSFDFEPSNFKDKNVSVSCSSGDVSFKNGILHIDLPEEWDSDFTGRYSIITFSCGGKELFVIVSEDDWFQGSSVGCVPYEELYDLHKIASSTHLLDFEWFNNMTGHTYSEDLYGDGFRFYVYENRAPIVTGVYKDNPDVAFYADVVDLDENGLLLEYCDFPVTRFAAMEKTVFSTSEGDVVTWAFTPVGLANEYDGLMKRAYFDCSSGVFAPIESTIEDLGGVSDTIYFASEFCNSCFGSRSMDDKYKIQHCFRVTYDFLLDYCRFIWN